MHLLRISMAIPVRGEQKLSRTADKVWWVTQETCNCRVARVSVNCGYPNYEWIVPVTDHALS